MKHRQKTIILSLVAIFILALVVKNAYESKSLNKNGVYVLGKIDKIDGAYQGVKMYVSYTYKGKVFKNNYVAGNFDKNAMMVKKAYFFKIDASKPNKFHIEYNIPVPDSLINSPYEGWDSLPIKH